MAKSMKDQRTEAETRATFIVDKGIDLLRRRLYAGAQSAEHNPDFDVGFMLARDMSVAINVLQNHFTPNMSMGEDPNKPIEIYLSTFGGDLYTGFGIFDTIEASAIPIHVYVYGPCMSAGALIMQAAQKRFVSKNSRLMLHYGSTWDEGTSNPKRVDELRREHNVLMDQMIQVFMSRINKSVLAEDRANRLLNSLAKSFPNSVTLRSEIMKGRNDDVLAEEMFREDILSIETYLTSSDAVRFGLADEIIAPLQPKLEPILSEA